MYKCHVCGEPANKIMGDFLMPTSSAICDRCVDHGYIQPNDYIAWLWIRDIFSESSLEKWWNDKYVHEVPTLNDRLKKSCDFLNNNLKDIFNKALNYEPDGLALHVKNNYTK
jgi:hypothetical protein